MRLKDLFTVPKGQKVTERHLRRVLISSICSILLCMSCLVGTTWAWFTVSIENTDNVIEIATVTADVAIYQGESEFGKSENGGYDLSGGEYRLWIKLQNNAAESDDLNKTRTPVYVLMSATSGETTAYYYFTFNGNAEADRTLRIGDEEVSLNFSVSWVRPVSASPIGEGDIIIGESADESVAEDSTGTDAEAPSDDSAIPSADETGGQEDETTSAPTEE